MPRGRRGAHLAEANRRERGKNPDGKSARPAKTARGRGNPFNRPIETVLDARHCLAWLARGVANGTLGINRAYYTARILREFIATFPTRYVVQDETSARFPDGELRIKLVGVEDVGYLYEYWYRDLVPRELRAEIADELEGQDPASPQEFAREVLRRVPPVVRHRLKRAFDQVDEAARRSHEHEDTFTRRPDGHLVRHGLDGFEETVVPPLNRDDAPGPEPDPTNRVFNGGN